MASIVHLMVREFLAGLSRLQAQANGFASSSRARELERR
jgi:hypothetical protein